MNLKVAIAALGCCAVLALGAGAPAFGQARVQFPPPNKVNASDEILKEFEDFYDQIERALQEKDLNKMMGFYADDYLYHGITKRQLKFMWLEILGTFSDLYSVHIFSKVEVQGGDAVLICTGALFGIAQPGEDYQTIDRWVTHPHWLTKVGGEWKMVGGGTRQAPGTRGSMELHPLF